MKADGSVNVTFAVKMMVYGLADRVRERADIEDYTNGELRALLCRVVYDAIVFAPTNVMRTSWPKRTENAQEELMIAEDD